MRLVVRVSAAISSTRAPLYPWAANSAVATSRISPRVRAASRTRSAVRSGAGWSWAAWPRAVVIGILRKADVATPALKPLTTLDFRRRPRLTNVLVRITSVGGPVSGAQRFLVGLIGSDLGPSLSPPLHEREADHLGVRYLYQRIDLDVLGLRAEDGGDLVVQAHRFGFAGLNITHPSKQAVVKYLDELSPEAAALGAVNTVVFRDRRAVGHNTDRSGFVAGFRRGLPDVRVRDVMLLGAGGAGAAVAFALIQLGTRRLTVVDVVLEQA